MPHILKTEVGPERAPRLAWVEAEGADFVRLTVSDAFGRSGSGVARVRELRELGVGGVQSVFAGDLLLVRQPFTEVWNVALPAAPDLGYTPIHGAEILGGLHQVELDHLILGYRTSSVDEGMNKSERVAQFMR